MTTISHSNDIWYLPLWERFTIIGTPTMGCKYIEVDGIGLMVEFNNENDLVAEKVRSHLIGKRGTACLVEADSEEEAIKIFNSTWCGAKVGTKSKALSIDTERQIKKIVWCERRSKTKDDKYCCGKPDNNGFNGELGMCVIEGYDAPIGINCPFEKTDE